MDPLFLGRQVSVELTKQQLIHFAWWVVGCRILESSINGASVPITDPWDWYIFTYMNGCFLMVNVGEYSSPMDPMGLYR